MTDVAFWRQRFRELDQHSVGPGDTRTEDELESHRRAFQQVVRPWLDRLRGPVLDFGCGVGRWVADLPRPYVGLDLLDEHLEICRNRWSGDGVQFLPSTALRDTDTHSVNAIFSCTVLQHIVEAGARRNVLKEFARILRPDGVALIVEWAEGQRSYDWCQPVAGKELRRYLSAQAVGEVIESGRRHTVWWASSPGPSWFARLTRHAKGISGSRS